MDSPPQIEIDCGPLILAIEDDPATLRGIVETLSLHVFHVIPATTWPAAVECLREQTFDLVLCGLPLDGHQLEKLMVAPGNLTAAPVVFLSRNEFLGGFIGTRGAHRFGVLQRPVSGRQLIACIRQSLKATAST